MYAPGAPFHYYLSASWLPSREQLFATMSYCSHLRGFRCQKQFYWVI